MLDLVNRHVTKIILAAEDGDSVASISRKTGSSYGWTHEWVQRLEEVGVVKKRNGVRILDEEFADRFEEVARTVLKRRMDLDDAYLLPNFAGMPYAYTKTDAVYVWTKGGYQIGRSRDDYPIFIAVEKGDVTEWREFFKGFGIEAFVEERDGEGIHFVLFPREDFRAEWVENASVIPLGETVEWMIEYEPNFQPALEMVQEMYDLDLGVTYREKGTV